MDDLIDDAYESKYSTDDRTGNDKKEWISVSPEPTWVAKHHPFVSRLALNNRKSH